MSQVCLSSLAKLNAFEQVYIPSAASLYAQFAGRLGVLPNGSTSVDEFTIPVNEQLNADKIQCITRASYISQLADGTIPADKALNSLRDLHVNK